MCLVNVGQGVTTVHLKIFVKAEHTLVVQMIVNAHQIKNVAVEHASVGKFAQKFKHGNLSSAQLIRAC